MSTNNHRVILSGDEDQEISFTTPHINYSKFATLELANTEGSINFLTETFVTEELIDHGCTIINPDNIFENR